MRGIEKVGRGAFFLFLVVVVVVRSEKRKKAISHGGGLTSSDEKAERKRANPHTYFTKLRSSKEEGKSFNFFGLSIVDKLCD